MTDEPRTWYGRKICAPETPYEVGAEGKWLHPQAHEVGEQQDGWPGGDIVRMQCEVCGHRWTEELPQ